MKRFVCIALVLVVLAALCGCTETNLRSGSKVVLSYLQGEKNIRVELPYEEAEKVISILDGKKYDPLDGSIPACGFDEDISLKVGNRVFAIAGDTCNILQDLGNFRYFHIPKEDMAYIHSLFNQYGGNFPG